MTFLAVELQLEATEFMKGTAKEVLLSMFTRQPIVPPMR